ncbi:MBL fold metallo-hydrolase [Candidatus Methylospira mobilis]|uniref:MBL fold metallo-hydrolase n=1 Tax=Candidatus Methylospira mobilis TaxID=1808979 RepID=A0A5Q0BKP7_9GAMM|nr:MBL fold metallo-hydrolase [Candidatus Methylospira mobilis]QFY42791.1 MBL fold metallo-hydrolase [Candidatus Methylospira mobilis]WNV03683.1 MBL fold metallo-hydrolase [Candidatus Methylospira mobilis]
MKTKLKLSPALPCFIILLLQGCTPTSHTVETSQLGRTSSSAEMESVIDQPGPIQLETINSADWSVPLSGLLNINSPEAIQAGLKDHAEPIQIYAHLLKHPQRGNYLIDTGVSRKLLDDPGKAGVGWLIRLVMPLQGIRLNKSTADILQGLDGRLSGVFFTHLHLDHISGMPDIPVDAHLYMGANESAESNLQNMLLQGTVDRFFNLKPPLQEWSFQADPQHQFEGIVDIFADGSVFAISVPGHTPGSTAYLVRTTLGPVLLTGDVSHTRWGWEHAVEPGTYTEDHERNLKNLKSLKNLVAKHPKIEVRLGHQP